MTRPRRILPVIVVSQFAGTALWFAVNAVAGDLQRALELPAGAVSGLVSAVQLGFIAGTFVFALLAIADRVAARWLFCACSLLGAGSTVAILAVDNYYSLLALRFATGFFLAGIYPVGMKIAASWYERGLGAALGFLVGALVLGTAFPHLVRSLGRGLDWQTVILVVSALAAAGGVLMALLVPPGPFLGTTRKLQLSSAFRVFRDADFRAAAFGYFGHMWELYAFWTFVPAYLIVYARSAGMSLDVSLWSFIIIGSGSLGCVAGGLLSKRYGSGRVAAVQLATSGSLCLLSPLLLGAPPWLFIPLLIVWGVTVAGDSPQFSALSAQNAPRELVGTALAVATCVGFAITIPAIQLLGALEQPWGVRWLFVALAPGPMLGLFAMRRLIRSAAVSNEATSPAQLEAPR